MRIIPTDFSDFSYDALNFTKTLKEIGEIVLINVVSKGETQEEIEAYKSEAQNELAEIEKELVRKGIKVKTHIRVGSPSNEIISTAEEENVSLIALSSHGKGWIKELLIGSTSCSVARGAKRPVLVVRNR